MNAPLTPQPPTLGSEVHRGADAAEACARLDPVMNPQGYAGCIDAAHEQNRQTMGSAYEAFDAGLYFVERRKFQILVGLAAKSTLLNRPLLQSDFGLADAHYREARDRIGATDDQVSLATLAG